MVLDRQRKLMDFVVVPLASGLRHVNPNYVTLAGFLVVFPAAILLWKSDPVSEPQSYALVLASILIVAHGLLDLLDGVIARTYQRETPLGDFLDHVVDRVADVLLLAAVSFSTWGDLRVGLWAIVATLLTSYLGTQAQAVGAGRMYTGFVARADRLVLLMAAPLLDHALAPDGLQISWWPGVNSVLQLVLWYIAVGGSITALERFVRIFLFLRRHPRSKPPVAVAKR